MSACSSQAVPTAARSGQLRDIVLSSFDELWFTKTTDIHCALDTLQALSLNSS